MSDKPVTGSCLCGNVTYEISGNLGIFQYCHCSRCRKFTGSAFAANLMVAPKDFRWLKGEVILPANSGHQEVMQRACIHSVVGLSSHTQNGDAFYCS